MIPTAIEAATTAWQNAVVALQLAQLRLISQPTPANIAAVKALSERVNTDAANLAELQSVAGSGVGSPGTGYTGTLYAGTTGVSIGPVTSPAQEILGTDVKGLPRAEDGWNYFRDVVDKKLPSIHNSLNHINSSTVAAGTSIVLFEAGAEVIAEVDTLPAIAFGLFVLMTEYVLGWVINLVGRWFPNPSIFGWHPLAWIRKGFIISGNELMKEALGYLDPIIKFIVSPIHTILGLFAATTNATASAHNKSTHLYQHDIPKAKTDAITTSQIYTDASIAALQGQQTDALAKVISDQNTALAAAKIEAGSMPAQMFQLLESELMSRLATDTATLSEIQHELATALPLEVETAANNAIATEDAALSAQALTLQSNYDDLNAQLIEAENGVTITRTNIAANEQLLAPLLSSPDANVAEVKQLQTAIITYTNDLNKYITTIDNLERQITGISTTLGRIHTTQQLRVAQRAPTEIIAVAGLATVLATMAKTLYNLKTYVDTCVVENCDPLNKNNIKNVLKDLLGATAATAEIAYVAEAVADPVGFADAQAPGMEGIDARAVALLNTIMGI